jgi:hypothetical protein
MSENITIFGKDVILEKIKMDVTMVGDGLLVTVSALDDEANHLWGSSTHRAIANLEDCTDELIPQLMAEFEEWKAIVASPTAGMTS